MTWLGCAVAFTGQARPRNAKEYAVKAFIGVDLVQTIQIVICGDVTC
jgi:hypothetical protein